jgi:4-oxalocrotonate tautomerase
MDTLMGTALMVIMLMGTMLAVGTNPYDNTVKRVRVRSAGRYGLFLAQVTILTTLPRRRKTMPFINIKITKEGATAEKKAELIKGVTDLMVTVLGKNPQTTVVIIEEVDTDNWGIGGLTVTQRRLQNH